MKRLFVVLATCAALGIFFSPAPAAVHKDAPVSKKARIIKERIARPSKSISHKPQAKAMVHKKTKAKVAAKKKGDLFWKVALNPVIMCIWIPMTILLFVVLDQVHRLYFQKEPDEEAGAAQEDADDLRTWDQRFRDRIKEFYSRVKNKSAVSAGVE